MGEVDDHCAPFEIGQDVVADLDTQQPSASGFPGVFSHSGASGFITRRSDLNTGSQRNGAHDRAAHAPADSADDQSECHRVYSKSNSTIVCLSVFRLPSDIGIKGRRSSLVHFPNSASAVLMGMG